MQSITGTVREVTATARKRCPECRRMVEAGEVAVLTDDRWMKDGIYMPHTGGRMSAERGAWHLWHPDCHSARRASIQEREDAKAAHAALPKRERLRRQLLADEFTAEDAAARGMTVEAFVAMRVERIIATYGED